MEFVNPMVERRSIIAAENWVDIIKELRNRITDYVSLFIPLIVEKISFIDRDVFHMKEIQENEFRKFSSEIFAHPSSSGK